MPVHILYSSHPDTAGISLTVHIMSHIIIVAGHWFPTVLQYLFYFIHLAKICRRRRHSR